MSKISMELIQELIQIAKDGIETIPPILHGKEKPLKIIECGNDPWKEAALKLDTKDLDRLIRGMVLFIRASFPSYYSSVSPVIVLYGCYIKRNPINEPELTRWIVANRVNPYEPFGTVMYPTATTYDEFLSCESS